MFHIREVTKRSTAKLYVYAAWAWQRTDKPSTKLKRWKAMMRLFD